MNEALGFCPNDRLVIINADDLGIAHSTNQAIFELFQKNSIKSASIMIPCSKAKEAAILCKQSNSANIGIHLTLTSDGDQFYKPVYKDD